MGLFDNASSVVINNKEVQSIVTANGGVLYEKPSSGSVPDDILISASKQVLSYYGNESSVLTATVLDENSQPCPGETVVFKKGGTVLSTQSTDNNGQCTYTYVSSGVGDVSIKVECMSLEKTYVIEDCEFTILDDTVVAPTSGDINFYSYDVESDFILTADYYPVNTWEWFWLRDAASNKNLGVFSSSYDKGSYFGITNLGYNGWKNITIILENNTLTFKYGNTTVSTDVSNYTPGTWKFIVNRQNTRFKNLKLKKLQ